MTPAEQQALIERSPEEIAACHKRFRERIAQKAAELEARSKPEIQTSEEPSNPVPVDFIGEWVISQRKSRSFTHTEPRPYPSMADIQKACCEFFNLSRSDLLAQRRTAKIVHARQVAMFLVKEMTPRSLPEIGRFFGGRDHTTVLHAIRKIGKKSASDPQLEADLGELRFEIRRTDI